MNNTKDNSFIYNNLPVIVAMVIIAAAVAPLIIRGKDSIITVHDNLDQFIPYFKMLKDNNLLLALDAPTAHFDNLSTLNYTYVSYNLLAFVFLIFDVFHAQIILYALKLIIGYFSMNLLLNYLFKEYSCRWAMCFISIAFALLPSLCVWWISTSSVPLFIYAFLKIKNEWKGFDKRIFWTLLLPLLSDFASAGFFVLCLWILGIMYDTLRNRSINHGLVIGLFLLLAGYILVDLRLFYSMLIIRIPNIKTLVEPATGWFSIKEFTYTLFGVDLSHSYHGPSFVMWVICPVTGVGLLAMSVGNIRKKLSADGNDGEVKNTHRKVTLWTLGIIVLCAFLSVLYKTGFNAFLVKVLPFFKGFNWGRFEFLNRSFWAVAFFGALMEFTRFNHLKQWLWVPALLQIGVVMVYPVSVNNNYNYTAINAWNYDKLLRNDRIVTYNQFYDEGLFETIKKDIGYEGEKAAAVGFHPSVLMYNGFSTVDGYCNMLSIDFFNSFRKVIAPTLDRNETFRNYYDSWGARAYLFCEDLTYHPTKKKNDKAANLYIDTNAFKELGGRYILSRGQIANSQDLGLRQINSYTDRDSIYNIYVYTL